MAAKKQELARLKATRRRQQVSLIPHCFKNLNETRFAPFISLSRCVSRAHDQEENVQRKQDAADARKQARASGAAGDDDDDDDKMDESDSEAPTAIDPADVRSFHTIISLFCFFECLYCSV